jgi:hypothetical protein
MEYDKIIFPAELMCWLGRQISEMFTTAGFNVNRLKMFILMMQIQFEIATRKKNHAYFE